MLNFRSLDVVSLNKEALYPSLLYRSGLLNHISKAAGHELFEVYGIRHCIDMRSDGELTHQGAPQTLIDAGINWHRSPIDAYDSAAISIAIPRAEDYVNYYWDMLHQARTQIIKALRQIVMLLPEPTVFNCFAGKDRTGIVAAVLLESLGASTAMISYDYYRSGLALVSNIQLFKSKWIRRGLTQEAYCSRLQTEMKTMNILQDRIIQRYGSFLGLLESDGESLTELRVLGKRFKLCKERND